MCQILVYMMLCYVYYICVIIYIYLCTIYRTKESKKEFLGKLFNIEDFLESVQ